MLVAHDPAKSRIGTYFGGNIKRLPGPDPDKICAERVALRKARAAGYPLVIGLAVIGPYQPDQESSRESRTLHPCGECRREFASASEMTPDTLFATHRLGEEPVIMERFTLEWLLREYCVADN
jgi:cytidine deaminase